MLGNNPEVQHEEYFAIGYISVSIFYLISEILYPIR